jgi:predicted transcriptional regulator
MITAKLKTILTASGCTLVLYESDKIANLKTDQSDQNDIIGLILQINEVDLDIKANAIPEHYNPLIIEIFQQVKLEDAADTNEVKFQMLLDKCKEVIVRVIADAEFKTIQPMHLTKIQETKYDANVIGWSMPFNLYYLHNENRIPCI